MGVRVVIADRLSMTNLDVCSRFGWEPQGNRFCMITSSDPNMGNVAPGVVIKNNVDFYHLDPKKGDFRLMRECPMSRLFVRSSRWNTSLRLTSCYPIQAVSITRPSPTSLGLPRVDTSLSPPSVQLQNPTLSSGISISASMILERTKVNLDRICSYWLLVIIMVSPV